MVKMTVIYHGGMLLLYRGRASLRQAKNEIIPDDPVEAASTRVLACRLIYSVSSYVYCFLTIHQ